MKTTRTTLNQAGAWAALGSVLAAGIFFSGGASGQEVLPAPPPSFKGQIEKVVVKLGESKLAAADQKTLNAAEARIRSGE